MHSDLYSPCSEHMEMMKSYKKTIYACYTGYITQAIVNNLGPLLFLTFQNQFDISVERIGFLITLNFGVQLVVDLLAAKYVDRIGYRISIVAAHIMASAGLLGMGLFPFVMPDPYLGLLAAIVLNGIGGGLIEVLISPIVEAAPSGEKEKAMSLLHSFYCFGQVGVVILSTLGFKIFGMEHWNYLPVIWAVVPFVNIFLFTKVPIRTLVEEDERLPVRKLFSMKMFWVFVLMMLCAGASEQAMSQWASYFAESSLQVSKTMGDLLGPCAFAALMGASRVFYGKCGDKIPLEKFILGSSILCIISYLFAVFMPVPVLSLLGCAMCGLSVGIMWPGTFSIAARECNRGGTAMFAFFALAGDAGCMAGPGLTGVVAEQFPRWGLKAGLLFAIVFPVGMAGILLGRRAGKVQRTPDRNL
ncbi:hypothetical protein GCM10008922_01840 [Faecalicatena contorta]